MSVLVVLPHPALSAKPPGPTCAATKLKAAGLKAHAKLLCYAKAVIKAVPVDGACLTKAEAKYATAWGKIEAKGGCATTGDAGPIEEKVDGFVSAVVAALPGTPPLCAPTCGANAFCEAATATCQCTPGFLMQGASCQVAPPGHPSTHTLADVCGHWTSGHVVTETDPLVASGLQCDAGTLRPGALADTLGRVNLFRWLVGLEPTTDDAALNAAAQFCANLEAWWDFGSPGNPHSPPASAKCYTPQGGSTAGQSNIFWGSGDPAQAIDNFMKDTGVATLGQRRWIVNPPLGPVGIGFWKTGGAFGDAECLQILGASGTGLTQPWVSVPNAGIVPLEVAGWTWSFHSSLGGIATASIAMRRVDDNTPLPIVVQTLPQGFGEEAISWTPNGWQAEAGKTYRVTVSGVTGGDVVYDVKPVVCN